MSGNGFECLVADITRHDQDIFTGQTRTEFVEHVRIEVDQVKVSGLWPDVLPWQRPGRQLRR